MDNDYDIDIRLASIFMPRTTEHWKQMKARQGKFVHYTTAENAMNIINSRVFWMRNAKCMNDYMEVSHGHDLLVEFFQKKDPNHREAFFKALEPCGKELAQNTINLFDKWWREIEFDTYIGCISEHESQEDKHGRLSMWRAYGAPSTKAAIVLKIPFEGENPIKHLGLVFSPVGYLSYDDLEKELTGIIDNITNNIDFLCAQQSQAIINRIFAMLIVNSVSLKHVGFREEKEWRMIYLPKLNSSEFMVPAMKTINGIPQTIYQMPLESNSADGAVGMSILRLIDKIIIGPSEYSYILYRAFETVLKEAGVEDAGSSVIVSGIPLRT